VRTSALLLLLLTTPAFAQDDADEDRRTADATDPDTNADAADADASDASDADASGADSADADAADADASDADASDADASDADSEDRADAGASDAGAARAVNADGTNADAAALAVPNNDGEITRRAKAVVVVTGDPDELLRAAASRLELALDDRVDLPSDAGLRAAFRGEPGENDGLERARRERRRLGWGDEDAPVVASIGRMTGADVVVLLRREGRVALEVFDVRAGAFFAEPPLLEPVEEAASYVFRAARAAARRQPSAPTAEETAVAAAENEPEAEEEEDVPPARLWLRKNWAYLVAGALLAGAVLVFLLRDDDERAPPVLVFQPGE